MPQFESQIVSILPTGIAPFAVASQTLVANLNANFLNGYGPGDFAAASHTHPASAISNATAAGIELLAAADAEEQRRSLQLSSLSGDPTVPIEGIAYHRTRINSGGSVSTRRRLNVIAGANITLSIADDPTDDETDVTITSTASGGSGSGDVRSVSLIGDDATLTDGNPSMVIAGPLVRSITVTLPGSPTVGRVFTVVNRASIWDVTATDGVQSFVVTPGHYVDLVFIPPGQYFSFGLKSY